MPAVNWATAQREVELTMGCENKNGNSCPCTYMSCERRGNCCACVAYHRDKNQMVACYFTPELERTYDRAMKNFISQFR